MIINNDLNLSAIFKKGFFIDFLTFKALNHVSKHKKREETYPLSIDSELRKIRFR